MNIVKSEVVMLEKEEGLCIKDNLSMSWEFKYLEFVLNK